MKPKPLASLNHFTVPAASCLALAAPLNGGTLVKAFLLHILEEPRLGDRAVEFLQDDFQPIGLVQRDFHRSFRDERLDPETTRGPATAKVLGQSTGVQHTAPCRGPSLARRITSGHGEVKRRG